MNVNTPTPTPLHPKSQDESHVLGRPVFASLVFLAILGPKNGPFFVTGGSKSRPNATFDPQAGSSARDRPGISPLPPFFLSEPVVFRRVYGLESYSRTQEGHHHHRQSVNATRVTSYQLSHEGDWPSFAPLRKANVFQKGSKSGPS